MVSPILTIKRYEITLKQAQKFYAMNKHDVTRIVKSWDNPWRICFLKSLQELRELYILPHITR